MRETFEVTGTRYITDEIKADDRQKAARWFHEKHGVAPDGVGDGTVVGRCEDCGFYYFDDEQTACVSDENGVMWCVKCPTEGSER